MNSLTKSALLTTAMLFTTACERPTREIRNVSPDEATCKFQTLQQDDGAKLSKAFIVSHDGQILISSTDLKKDFDHRSSEIRSIYIGRVSNDPYQIFIVDHEADNCMIDTKSMLHKIYQLD